MDYLPSCDACRKIYSERTPPGQPPCKTCREEPLEENEDALNIFFLVKNQLIIGMSGIVDVNHQAIHEAIRLYKIENPQKCFEKVISLSRWWINEIVNKSESHEGWGES